MNAPKSKAAGRTIPLVLTISLFALWGLGHRLYDTLLPQFARVFAVQGFELTLAWSLYSFVYFLGAIPAALYARRFGYKAAILAGLGVFCFGAFVLYPAVETHRFVYFVFAVGVMSCGWVLLEVAANPLAANLGSNETSVCRLNLAQAFFVPGAIVGIYCARWLLQSNLAIPSAKLAHSIVHPYIVLGVVLVALAFVIDDTRFPPVATDNSRGLRNVSREFATLLSRPLFIFAVAAQFFAVVAMGGTWSLSGRFFETVFPGFDLSGIRDPFVWAFCFFGVGRFVGTALMVRFSAERVLLVFAAGGFLSSVVSFMSGGALAALAMLVSNFFLSITWPTVLGIGIRGLGPLTKVATALICMGGAVGGFGYHFLSLFWTPNPVEAGMLVPVVSYLVIFGFAMKSARAGGVAASAPGH